MSPHLDTLRFRGTFQIKGQIVNTVSIAGQVVCVTTSWRRYVEVVVCQ